MSDLPTVLTAVNWHNNITTSFSDKGKLGHIEAALHRIAVWSNQLEIVDFGNPALCFTREMQIAAQQGAALLGLCIYKASAAASRTLLETCLYYTYFRTHPEELATLIRVEKYYVTKSEVLDYHKIHTARFIEAQEAFGLIGNLETWYSKISAVIHGQIPGAWNAHTALSDISYSKDTFDLASANFLKSEELVHQILLCTCGRQLWGSFAPDAKSFLSKSLSGSIKSVLALDTK